MHRQAQLGRIWWTLLAALIAALVAALVACPAAAQPQFPALTGRVVDLADLLPPAEEQALGARLAALEAQSQRQLVVATLPDLQGYEIADYGYQLGRAWGLGDKERNDGALLIVAPNQRKVRIEVGYGLEGVLTDALSSLIINETIVPRFRAGDYPGGIAAGVERLVAHLQLPEDQARRVAEQAQAKAQPPAPAAPQLGFGSIVFLLVILLFFVLPMLRAMRGRGRRRRGGGGLGPIILWSALNSMSHGNRSGGFGGGFGGGGFGGGGFGGGFGGGGGSFGGGGASGSW